MNQSEMFYQILTEYFSQTEQRLGQYYVNTYCEGEVKPDIFYDEDVSRTCLKIINDLKEKGYE